MNRNVKSEAVFYIAQGNAWVLVIPCHIEARRNSRCRIYDTSSLLTRRGMDTCFLIDVQLGCGHDERFDQIGILGRCQVWIVLKEIFLDQSRYTSHMRGSHTGSLHIAIGIVVKWRVNIATWCCHIWLEQAICRHTPAREVRQTTCSWMRPIDLKSIKGHLVVTSC